MKNFFKSFKKLEIIGLLLLLLVAGFFRFYQLGKTPPGTNVDETAFGYNAYSINKIGRDEWGIRYPLIFKSFGDYKPPGLVYTIAFLLNFFPLSTFIVRLPSAISGFLAIIGIFLLVKEFFPQKRFFPLFGAIIFAFSPWSFQLSRLFFDSNVALGIFIFGLFFLFRFINRQIDNKTLLVLDKSIWGAVFCFSLCSYFYVAYKVVGALLLFFALLLLFLDKKVTIQKAVLILFSYVIFIAPLLPQSFSATGRQRLAQQNNLINFGSELIINEKRGLCYLSSNKNPTLTKICYFFWNKPLLRLEGVAKSFVGHFSPEFLFFRGDESLYDSPQGYGNLHLCLIPFYFLGLFAFFKQIATQKKVKLDLLLAGLFLSPIPSSLVGTPSMHRANLMLPFLTLVILLGIDLIVAFLKKRIVVKQVFFFVLPVFLMLESFRYLTNYFWAYTKSNDLVWRNGILPVMAYVQENQDKYDQIIFSNFYGEDIILNIAFYQKIDPDRFVKNVRRGPTNKYGWVHISSLGKYQQGAYNLRMLTKDYNSKEQGSVLFITAPIKEYSHFVEEAIYNEGHTLRLAEIYDIGKLKKKIEENDGKIKNRK